MKEAKQNFDDLVARIENGKKVSFGEMEQVYARAFLERFLEKISTDTSNEKIQQFYRSNIVDPDEAEDYREREGEEMSLSLHQLTAYSLELVSTMSGVLGIRATAQQLSPFIEKALRERNWELLEKVLALSEEGRMGTDVIEKVALEQLVNNRKEFYPELKQRFGNFQFNQDKINDVYHNAVRTHNTNLLKRLNTETGFSVPSEYIQEECELILENPSFVGTKFALIEELTGSSGYKPVKTKRIKKGLIDHFQRNSLDQVELDSAIRIFDITTDEKISSTLQQIFLEKSELNLFKNLYEQSGQKLNESKIRVGYKMLSNKGQLDEIYQVIMITGASPQKQIVKKVYSQLLEKNKLREIDQLAEKIKVEPVYDQDIANKRLSEVSGRLGRAYELGDFRNLVNVVKRGKGDILPQYVHEAAKNRLETYKISPNNGNFNDCVRLIDELYQDIGLKPSQEVTAAKISGLTSELYCNLNNLEENYSKEI
ncbi:hypothetical protein J4456_05425 [Candidatus Pacearchaeota archaeon]|nr:hypothetical protein [Candidatus Pacearchaeota archaeon]